MKLLNLLLAMALMASPAVAAELAPPPPEPEAPPAVEAPAGPPPTGWVFGPYTTCAPPQPHCFVTVPADGLNIRQAPDGPPFAAVVNGMPLTVYGNTGNWLLVRVDCPLLPTGLWSWTAGVPLLTCYWGG